MSVGPEMPTEIREAAARITHVLIDENGDHIVDGFVEVCRGLPPPGSTVDIASAIETSVCLRLESIMMRCFQQRLRPRSGRTVPRPITEIRAAASKAWNLLPLVLLVEYTDAPISDNFYRLFSRLARVSSDWITTRNLLHDARARRRIDPLARRKGVSRTQAWAIPDVEAVLKCHQNVPNSVSPEIPDEEPEETKDVHGFPMAMEDVWFPETSVQPRVWRLIYGWWLSPDIVHCLFTSLVWFQPTFRVVDPRIVHSATAIDLSAHPSTVTTLAVPQLVEQFNRWELCVFSRAERIVSVYQAVPSDQTDGRTTTTFAKRQADTGQLDTEAKAARKRLAALRSNVAEAGALWLTIANAAIKVQADLRTVMDSHSEKLRNIRKRLGTLRKKSNQRLGADQVGVSHGEKSLSLSISRLEKFVQALEPQTSELSVKRRAIDAVLKDIHEFKPCHPPEADYSLRAVDVTSDGWMRDIPADRPTLVIAEGLFMYIRPEEVVAAVKGMVEHFRQGELILDTVSNIYVKHTTHVVFLQASGAKWFWGTDDAQSVDQFHHALKMIEWVWLTEYIGSKMFGQSLVPLFGEGVVGVLKMALGSFSSSHSAFGQNARFEFNEGPVVTDS